MTPDFSILVPAYQEEANIADTLATVTSVMQQIGLENYEIIVVDDGSTDATSAIVTKAAEADPRLRLVCHPKNRGLGAAIRSGIDAVRSEKAMVVPGDNDVSADFISVMARYRNVADFVIAAPLNLEIRPYFRIILSLVYRLLYFVAFNVYVFYINAPSVWPVGKLRQIGIKSNRFSIVSEINTKLLRIGCSFAEVPGYFSGGKPGGAVSLRNLVEVMRRFLELIWEIHVSKRALFGKRPTRVYFRFDDGGEPSVADDETADTASG